MGKRACSIVAETSHWDELVLDHSKNGTIETYLVIVNEDNNCCFPSNLLNGIEVSKGIHLIQSTIDADTGACSSVPDRSTGFTLKLTSTALSPLG
jgi:hypothetical protein